MELQTLLPIEGLELLGSSGQEIEENGAAPTKALWRVIQPRCHYKAYLEQPLGQPFLFIKGTSKVVGAILRIEKGTVLLLPVFTTSDLTGPSVRSTQLAYIEALLGTIKEMNASTGDFKVPLWADRFRLPGETKKIEEIAERERGIAQAIMDRDKAKGEMSELQAYKIMFSGTGKALEITTSKVLTELGFVMEDVPPGRDDLIGDYRGRQIVAEVKGKTKSAAERDAAQLEKWVSGHFERTGVEPKGLLIVNAFCNTPLDERGEAAFPDQMIAYSVRKGLCLLTASHLLGILLEFRTDRNRGERLIEDLLKTVGVYAGRSLADHPEIDVQPDSAFRSG